MQCPIDELNRPRGQTGAALRIPPSDAQVRCLFAGWRGELATCRKYAPTARNYAAARLMAEVGLRVNEARNLDLADIKWELGRFGKLHVRHGKGARGSGPRERIVPLINDAGRTLRWFVADVWGHFDDDHTRPGAPLFCSERRNADGTSGRVGAEALRAGLAQAALSHLPTWAVKSCSDALGRTGRRLTTNARSGQLDEQYCAQKRIICTARDGSRPSGKRPDQLVYTANRTKPPSVLQRVTEDRLVHWTPTIGDTGKRHAAGMSFLQQVRPVLDAPKLDPTAGTEATGAGGEGDPRRAGRLSRSVR